MSYVAMKVYVSMTWHATATATWHYVKIVSLCVADMVSNMALMWHATWQMQDVPRGFTKMLHVTPLYLAT